MTGTEILARAEYLIDDDIDVVEALEQINLGILDMSLEAPFEDSVTLVLAEGERHVDVPSDCVEIIEVRVSGVEIGAAISPFSNDSTAEGTPSEYYVLGEELKLYPLADAAYNVDILFLSAYTELSALTETPDIPARFHWALVNWLAAQFRTSDEEEGSSDRFMSKYYDYRARLKMYQQSRSAYSITREG